MTHTITLCQSCPGTLAALADDLAGALAPLQFRVTATECMSGCTRPAVVAFRAPGKTAYLFGDLSGADLPGLLTFARAYLDSPDGTFADARPLGTLRAKAIARIPG
jgi:predicted metal-binding protein